jgi:chitodextrinase
VEIDRKPDPSTQEYESGRRIAWESYSGYPLSVPRHWQIFLMAALGICATVIAVPRALSGIVAVPQENAPGISRTAAVTPSTKPSTAKMPVWTAPASGAISTTPDTRPPSAVSNLRLVSNGGTAIAIAWDMSQDNVAVKLYVVRGNGFTTLETADTKATVQWGHRTANVSIQVSAVDTSGNQGEWRSLLVVPPAAAATTATTAPTTSPATSSTPVETTAAPSEPAASESVPTDASSGATTVSSAGAPDPASNAATADQATDQPV